MAQLSIKSGDSLIVNRLDGDVVLTFDRIGSKRASLTVDTPEDISIKRGEQRKLDTDVHSDFKYIAEEVTSLLSEVDTVTSQEILAQFVSDLFYAQAQRRQQECRRQKQAEGIAEAKTRGVRFGRSLKPLPANFQECHEAWRSGQMSLREAAKNCGMAHSSFHDAVDRIESAR